MAILENPASPQPYSMKALDNATRNAGELYYRLTNKYNRRNAILMSHLANDNLKEQT